MGYAQGIDETTFKAIDSDGDGRLSKNELIIGISQEMPGIRRSEVQRYKVANRSAEDKELIEVGVYPDIRWTQHDFTLFHGRCKKIQIV